MNKNNRVVIVLLIIIIVLLAFLILKPKEDIKVATDTSYEEVNTTSNINSYNPQNVSVSTALPSGNYIGGQANWPPVIKHSSEKYGCDIQHDDMIVTVERSINNRKYCITSTSEGSAGAIHYSYIYTTPSSNGSGVETTNFTLRYISCGGYGGPGDAQYNECKTAQSSLNIDAIVDSLIKR